MRILIAIDSLGIGGKERQAVELIKGLSSVPGISVRVVCLSADDFYLPDLLRIGVMVDIVPRRIRWDVRLFVTLGRLVKSFQPDVIHTNGLVSSFYCLPLAKQSRIPLVNGSIRNAFTEVEYRWKVERWLLACSDYRVANSRAGMRSRNFPEEDPRNIVIYNGFDLSRAERTVDHRCDPRAEAATTKIVGMVAEFNRYKDYLTFIEAARVLSRKRRDVIFVAVGDGDTFKECEVVAEGLPNVRFLGQQKDVESIVQTFDVGVLCSFVEGLSNSIMEYMAFGKPVVATDGGGTSELVADGATGLLVKQRDPLALAGAVEYLIDHPEVAERMGLQGQRRLKREFTLARMVDQTVALYASATSHPLRKRRSA